MGGTKYRECKFCDDLFQSSNGEVLCPECREFAGEGEKNEDYFIYDREKERYDAERNN